MLGVKFEVVVTDCFVAALLAMTVFVRLIGIVGMDCFVAALLAMTVVSG